jgi:hypothetical protein
MAGKTRKDYEDTYTDPALRERLKEELKAGDRAAGPGSGRRASPSCSSTSTRRPAAATSTRAIPTASQEHLREWSDQDWHTKDGDAQARGPEGTSRYLPDAAWKLLSEAEREATDRRKRADGHQHVENTRRRRRRAARPSSWT